LREGLGAVDARAAKRGGGGDEQKTSKGLGADPWVRVARPDKGVALTGRSGHPHRPAGYLALAPLPRRERWRQR